MLQSSGDSLASLSCIISGILWKIGFQQVIAAVKALVNYEIIKKYKEQEYSENKP